jgi:hypothetical protein
MCQWASMDPECSLHGRQWARGRLVEIFAVLFAMCASAAVPTVADGSIPPDPVAPANDQVCLDLHAHYRTLIDRMSEQADACHAERPTYIQGRYGHDFSECECARHVVEKPCLRRSAPCLPTRLCRP